MHTFGEYGQADAPNADKIMHAMLETPSSFTLMASDTPPGMPHNPGNNITVSLSDDDTELRGYANAQPLQRSTRTATTGPCGGESPYWSGLSYLAHSNSNAPSRSFPSSSTSARPSARAHHSADQSSA